MTKHWNYDEARGMRAQGVTWDEIGRVFGVSAYTAHMRTDPNYAAKNHDRYKDRRKQWKSLGSRTPIRHLKDVVIPATQTAVFDTPSGIKAYRKEVPNRVSILPADQIGITLPYVSILGEVR